MPPGARRLGIGFGLIIVYVLAAKLGLSFAFLHASATPVWPPTGIALAALLVFGVGMWPGVFGGAFLANLLTAGSVATSLGIALGNTLEAVIGAGLVNRFAGGRAAFERAQDIFKFVGLAGLLSTAVSATIGVTGLSLGGYARWADYGAIWTTWWLGDAAGALVVTPVLLLWSRPAALALRRRRAVEAASVAAVAVAVGAVVFGGMLPAGITYAPIAFVCIPPLLWAAFRFGQREAATLIVMLSGVAVAGTLSGTGPFALATPNGSLLLLQAFMATMALTMLPVGAVVSEWRRTTEQLRTVLADEETLLGEREQAMAAVRESEARLHGMIHAAMDAILSVDEQQRIVVFNAAAERMFRRSAVEAIGQPLDRFIPARVRDAHRRHIQEFGRHGVTARRMGALGELTGLRADGEEFPIEASISEAQAGRQKLFTVILRDITERKRGEAALRASEEKAATVFRTSPSAIALSTVEGGRYLDANEAFLRMVGYGREELIGRTALELGIWKDPEERGRALRDLVSAGTIRNWEATFRRKSGEEFTALSACELLDMDGRPVVLANVLDITERKRAEQAVAAYKALLEAILNQAAEGIVVRDAAGRVTFANAVARRLAILPPDGTPLETAASIWADARDAEGRLLPVETWPSVRALRGETVTGVEWYRFAPDGTRSVLLKSAAPLRDSTGTIIGVVGTTTDITEVKRKEDDLRQALADKDTLLREVHHRVKNNFQTLCDLLYLQAMSLEGREAQRILLDTYGRMFAMARLHEQLYQSLTSGEVRLAEYLGRLVHGFESVHTEVPIRFDVSGDGISLDVDRAIHTGLIMNELVTNAVKHAFHAGKAGEVAVRLCTRDDHLELQVRDTGTGLPAEFDLTQAKSLGLRIVHILAQRLNATVTVENDGGACFTIRFPLKGE